MLSMVTRTPDQAANWLSLSYVVGIVNLSFNLDVTVISLRARQVWSCHQQGCHRTEVSQAACAHITPAHAHLLGLRPSSLTICQTLLCKP